MQQSTKWAVRVLRTAVVAAVMVALVPGSATWTQERGGGREGPQEGPVERPHQHASAAGQFRAAAEAVVAALRAEFTIEPAEGSVALGHSTSGGSRKPAIRAFLPVRVVSGQESWAIEDALVVRGPLNGDEAVRVLRARVGPFRPGPGAPASAPKMQLYGQRNTLVWEGPSQHTAGPTPGPEMRPVYKPRIICIETVDLEGEWPGLVPASQEGILPVTIECVDVGWMQATGSLRTVGKWTVPASVWMRPEVHAYRLSPATKRRLGEALAGVRQGMPQVARVLGESDFVRGRWEPESDLFAFVWGRTGWSVTGVMAQGFNRAPDFAGQVLFGSVSGGQGKEVLQAMAVRLSRDGQGNWRHAGRVLTPDGKVLQWSGTPESPGPVNLDLKPISRPISIPLGLSVDSILISVSTAAGDVVALVIRCKSDRRACYWLPIGDIR